MKYIQCCLVECHGTNALAYNAEAGITVKSFIKLIEEKNVKFNNWNIGHFIRSRPKLEKNLRA